MFDLNQKRKLLLVLAGICFRAGIQPFSNPQLEEYSSGNSMQIGWHEGKKGQKTTL